MAIERFAQGVGFVARDAQRFARYEDQTLAHHGQVHGVRARPELPAWLSASGEQGECTGGNGLVAEVEGIVQPALQLARLRAQAAPPDEQKLERGQPRLRLAGKESGNDELAVHQAGSGTTRTPRLPRWRARM